jgi:hypothetical protein
MEIEISTAGSFNFNVPQQVWSDETDPVMQTSKYAGQEMKAVQKPDDEPDVYELHYLGLEVSGFNSMSDAKFYASPFAKAVLGELSKLIIEAE